MANPVTTLSALGLPDDLAGEALTDLGLE